MYPCLPMADDAQVEIRISLKTSEPPTGSVILGAPFTIEQPPMEVAFTGWLGLLRALDEILARSDGAPSGTSS